MRYVYMTKHSKKKPQKNTDMHVNTKWRHTYRSLPACLPLTYSNVNRVWISQCLWVLSAQPVLKCSTEAPPVLHYLFVFLLPIFSYHAMFINYTLLFWLHLSNCVLRAACISTPSLSQFLRLMCMHAVLKEPLEKIGHIQGLFIWCVCVCNGCRDTSYCCLIYQAEQRVNYSLS